MLSFFNNEKKWQFEVKYQFQKFFFLKNKYVIEIFHQTYFLSDATKFFA